MPSLSRTYHVTQEKLLGITWELLSVCMYVYVASGRCEMRMIWLKIEETICYMRLVQYGLPIRYMNYFL